MGRPRLHVGAAATDPNPEATAGLDVIEVISLGDAGVADPADKTQRLGTELRLNGETVKQFVRWRDAELEARFLAQEKGVHEIQVVSGAGNRFTRSV